MEPLNLVTGEGLDVHHMRDYQAKSLYCKLFVFYGIRWVAAQTSGSTIDKATDSRSSARLESITAGLAVSKNPSIMVYTAKTG